MGNCEISYESANTQLRTESGNLNNEKLNMVIGNLLMKLEGDNAISSTEWEGSYNELSEANKEELKSIGINKAEDIQSLLNCSTTEKMQTITPNMESVNFANPMSIAEKILETDLLKVEENNKTEFLKNFLEDLALIHLSKISPDWIDSPNKTEYQKAVDLVCVARNLYFLNKEPTKENVLEVLDITIQARNEYGEKNIYQNRNIILGLNNEKIVNDDK